MVFPVQDILLLRCYSTSRNGKKEFTISGSLTIFLVQDYVMLH